jgi:hypothetical protein
MEKQKRKSFRRPEVRVLKIQSQFRKAKRSYKFVPEIKLCGNWLEKTGFTKGRHASIAVMNRLLIIRLEEE